MKLELQQDPQLKDIEVIIRYARLSPRLEWLMKTLRLYDTYLLGRRGDTTTRLTLDEIYYFEVVDGRTFAYTQADTFEVEGRLYELDQRLWGTSFAQISKSVLLNLDVLRQVRVAPGSRLEALLDNGERLVISRHYVQSIKQKLSYLGGSSNEAAR